MRVHVNSHNSLFVLTHTTTSQEKSSRILNLLRDSYLSISDGDDVLIDKSEYVDDDDDDEYGKDDDDYDDGNVGNDGNEVITV